MVQPSAPSSVGDRLRVGAWNIERGGAGDQIAALIEQAGIDVALISEADIGMARTGNCDTIARIANRLGFGHCSCVEFVELGLGDDRESELFSQQKNTDALHCNAVIARFPIEQAAGIALDEGGRWFHGLPGKGQRRVGGRIALAVRLAMPREFWFVSTHFESEGTARDRSCEARRLVEGLDKVCKAAPVVLGGDFNFARYVSGTLHDARATAQAEPSFAVFKEAGFEWVDANEDEPTTRDHPWQHDLVRTRIDWLFARGAGASNPGTVAAVDAFGQAVSDHDLIHCEVILP